MLTDEDLAYGKWQQAKIERDWDSLPSIIACHQKVGTTVPFSRTVDRDPNPRIPLSIPDVTTSFTKRDALIWLAIVCGWLAFVSFGNWR